MSEAIDKINAIIIKSLCLGSNYQPLTTEQKLGEDLGADSLDVIELAMDIEDEFSIIINDEDSDKWVTVDDVYECVAAKLSLVLV